MILRKKNLRDPHFLNGANESFSSWEAKITEFLIRNSVRFEGVVTIFLVCKELEKKKPDTRVCKSSDKIECVLIPKWKKKSTVGIIKKNKLSTKIDVKYGHLIDNTISIYKQTKKEINGTVRNYNQETKISRDR